MEFRVRFPQTSQHAHARLSQQNLSKPLPTKPEQDYATYSRQSGRSVRLPRTDPSLTLGTYRTIADSAPQAAEQYKQQSLQKLDGKDSRGRSSADLPSGHAPPGSIGRRATVDARPSSAQAATRGSNGARRKPVREPSPAEFFEWNPTDEPQVLTTVCLSYPYVKLENWLTCHAPSLLLLICLPQVTSREIATWGW